MTSPDPDVNNLFDQLTVLFSAQLDIVFATVFGSVADGTARRDSDLDVALLADGPLSPDRRRQLVSELADVAGRPVDLVDLYDAGPVVLLSALRGRRLVGRGSAANAALLSRAWTDVADFLPVRQQILDQRLVAWTN